MGVASLLVALISTSALAQGAPQSVTERRTEVLQTGSGFRASKLAGTSVYNRDKDKIGTIDDLILSPSDHSAFAILSVGGFLGMGKHYVAVPFSDIRRAVHEQKENTRTGPCQNLSQGREGGRDGNLSRPGGQEARRKRHNNAVQPSRK